MLSTQVSATPFKLKSKAWAGLQSCVKHLQQHFARNKFCIILSILYIQLSYIYKHIVCLLYPSPQGNYASKLKNSLFVCGWEWFALCYHVFICMSWCVTVNRSSCQQGSLVPILFKVRLVAQAAGFKTSVLLLSKRSFCLSKLQT